MPTAMNNNNILMVTEDSLPFRLQISRRVVLRAVAVNSGMSDTTISFFRRPPVATGFRGVSLTSVFTVRTGIFLVVVFRLVSSFGGT